MNLETFIDRFDQFADAPDAVAKIRELVLELAVQGKLVEQQPIEGDGHALLKLIRKRHPPSVGATKAVYADAVLPSFPRSWAPSTLGEVSEIIRGVSFPGSAKSEARSPGDVACLRTASVQAEIDWDDLIYISPSFVSRADQWVATNDIVISMANSYALVGKVAIVRQVPQKATFGAFLAAIRPVLIEPFFLLYVLRSPRMQAAFRASSSQTTNIANISLGRMRPLPFPLPPLAEQKRIVAKVDELMALCDQLEAQQQERETGHHALTRASLARFTDAPTQTNLNYLFHPAYATPPADLRKSILTLAVQGKLVPQDPNDEPADGLLARIRAEKKRLMAPNEIRRAKGWTLEEEVPQTFELPASWVFSTLAEIGLINPRNEAADDLDASFVPMKLISAELREPHAHEIRKWAEIKTGFTHFAEGDVALAKITPCFENGKSAVMRNLASGIGAGTTELHVVRPILVEAEYLLIFLKSWLFVEAGIPRMTGTAGQKRVPTSYFAAAPFPLPPLAEQRRIVAKVEHLMDLVDALESQLAASRTSGADLVRAVVAELTSEA